MHACMAAVQSILKTDDVSAMFKQGFISSPTHYSSRFSPKFSPPPSSSSTTNYPSPPPPSFPSPKPSTLYDMISQEELLRPLVSPQPLSLPHQKRIRLQQRLSKASAVERANWGPGDVDLSVSSRDGFRVSTAVHRRVLAARSRFFAEKLGLHGGGGSAVGSRVAVEICDCDDAEVYVEAVAMMYCGDLRRWLAGEEVGRVLGLLKVSAAIMFDAGVASCLEFLEAVPWSEDDEEKVVSVLKHLQLHEPVTGVLQRVLMEPSSPPRVEDILVRLLAGILQAKDEKARRVMKTMIAGLLLDDVSQNNNLSNGLDVSKETFYHLCHKCLSSLLYCLSETANMDESCRDRVTLMGEIAREADNVQWLVEILISKKMGEEFVTLWADQMELASLHSKIPRMYRFELSRITAQLCIAIGKGQILVPRDVRFSLLRTWLEALYEDFHWMKRACRMLDKKVVEDGLCQTILTLSMEQQQAILMRWFEHFLNKGDDCPNIQKAFEVWWRRAFFRHYVGGDQDHFHLQITVCNYPS